VEQSLRGEAFRGVTTPRLDVQSAVKNRRRTGCRSPLSAPVGPQTRTAFPVERAAPARFGPGQGGHPAGIYRAQAQSAPQLQVSPHEHPARRAGVAAWQPQVQVDPAHDVHEQVFGVVGLVLVDMSSSFEGG